jgi:hypothetical protein
VDDLDHLPLVLLEYHQTLEAHYQNQLPVQELDPLLEQVLVPQVPLVEPTFVVE